MSADRKSTSLNSSHTDIYTLSLHDALPISYWPERVEQITGVAEADIVATAHALGRAVSGGDDVGRSEEHKSELQSHRYLHSFPTRRSSDLLLAGAGRTDHRRRRS